MLKLYTLCLFSLFFYSSSSLRAQTQALDSLWNNQFIKKYSEAIIKHDSTMYFNLLISQVEIDSIVASLKTENPNCITDIESTMNVSLLKKQFQNVLSFFRNVRSIKFGKGYYINGCADIKGIKFNISGICGPQKVERTRTLSFIQMNNSRYKLIFDVAVTNSNQ